MELGGDLHPGLGYLDRQPNRLWRPLLALVLVTVIGSAVIALLRPHTGPSSLLDAVYVPGIVLVAIRYGFRWALATICVTIVVFDMAFVEPIGQLTKSSGKYYELLALSAGAALVAFLARVAFERATEVTALRRETVEEAARLEALRRREAVKTSILRSVSHDFRSPLTALSTAVQVLQDEDAKPEAKAGMAEVAAHSTEELKGLVDNVLDLAKLESGAEPNPEWVSIEEILSRSLARVPELEAEVDVGRLPVIRADPGHLESVFVNLLKNAEEHGGGRAVRVDGSIAAADRVRVVVSDEGPGIPNELGEDAFEAFRSGRAESGGGLGLAIVRGFTEAGGGRVFARAEGRGTAIVLELPVAGPTPQADGHGEAKM